jgi:hypothetical protein
MALSNLLVKGSYAKIQSVYIDPAHKIVRAVLEIYKDSSKVELITTMDYMIDLQKFIDEKEAEKDLYEAQVKASLLFDDIFGGDVLSKKGNNIFKAVYNYIKSREEGIETKDA